MKRHKNFEFTPAGLGELLRGRRHELGKKQTEMATITGVPNHNISEIEAGKKAVTIDTLQKLVKGYRLQITIEGAPEDQPKIVFDFYEKTDAGQTRLRPPQNMAKFVYIDMVQRFFKLQPNGVIRTKTSLVAEFCRVTGITANAFIRTYLPYFLEQEIIVKEGEFFAPGT